MEEYKLSPNVAISESGFVFIPSSGETFTLNSVGMEILNEVKEEKSEEEIIEKITSEYEVEERVFEKDLTDFVGQLKKFNLLVNK